MKKFGLCALGLASVLSLVGPSAVFAAEADAKDAAEAKVASDYLNTTISSDKDVVTVKVALEKGSELTSGIVKLDYDAEEMTLVDYEVEEFTDFVDFNNETMTYAFVSMEPCEKAAELISATFKVVAPNSGKAVSVEASFTEAYDEAGAVELGEAKVASTKLKMPTELTSKNTKIAVTTFIPVSLFDFGLQVKAIPSVTEKGKTSILSEGKNYTCVIKDQSGKEVSGKVLHKSGTYTIEINGLDNYTGQVTKTFTATKKEVKLFGITIAAVWTLK